MKLVCIICDFDPEESFDNHKVIFFYNCIKYKCKNNICSRCYNKYKTCLSCP